VEVGAEVVGDGGVAGLRGERTGLHVEEELKGGYFVGAMAGVHFVAGEAEVAHDQFLVRVGLVDQRFEVAEVLLTVGEAAADEGDVVAFLQLEGLGLRAGEAEHGEEEGEQRTHVGVLDEGKGEP